MPLIDKALYVEGELVGISWQFRARCYVEDPAGSMNWRRGSSGEVEVHLDYLGEWWQVTTEIERKNCDANGVVEFAGSWATGSYAMEAKHNVSGDRYKIRLDCHDDGTWDETVEIE